MRLDEIRYDKRDIAQQNPEREALVQWLLSHGIKNHRIDLDNVVHVTQNVDIHDNDMEVLPVQFGKVRGRFTLNATSLISMRGCPSEVSDDCWINVGSRMKSLMYAPPITRILGIYDSGVASVRGIHKVIKQTQQVIIASNDEVVEGGIGLLMIPKLVSYTVGFADEKAGAYLWEQFNNPDRDIHEIQEHMIQAGWGAYAKL